jgi:hypothetical protein
MKFTGKPVIIEGLLALKEIIEYPIGGYAPCNYWCHCTNCKERFSGDKRAVQYEPCARKMIGKSALRTLFVKDCIINDSGTTGRWIRFGRLEIHESCLNEYTITADIDSNNELINLELI